MSEFTPEEVEALRLALACQPRMVESATVLAIISGYQRLMGDVLTLSDKLSRAVVVEGKGTPIVLPAGAGLDYINGDDGYWLTCGTCEEPLVEVKAGTSLQEMAEKVAAHKRAEAAQAEKGGTRDA